MANVHGLNEFRDEGPGNGPQYRSRMMGGSSMMQGLEGQMPAECEKSLRMYAGVCGTLCGNEHLRPHDGKRAMNENFWDMWKNTFCPQCVTVSFTAFLVAINFLFFILTVVFTCISDTYGHLNSRVFLGPAPRLLDKWGAKNPYQIQQHYQVWRLFTPALLSNGFSQCFIGIIMLLLIGSMIESSGMGPKRMGILYAVTTIGGYRFGATCNNSLSVGCIPGVFGLLSALFSNVIKNWKAMEKLDTLRFFLIMFSMGIFAIALMVTMNRSTIGSNFTSSDIYANLGAFICGIFFSMIVIPANRSVESARSKSYESIISFVGLVGTIFFFIVTGCFMFLGKTRDPLYID